jgi:hypothetical protein
MAESRQWVSGVFRDRASAEQAFDTLRGWGYTDREINVLMSDQTRSQYYPTKAHEKHEVGTKAAEGMGVGGAIGTAVGAGLAAILAIGTSLALPGLGLVVAGPIAAALAGGGAGAVTGGVVGALVGWGIPESNAQAYQDALRNGGVVIGVQARDSKDVHRIEKAFKDLQGENVYSCAC